MRAKLQPGETAVIQVRKHWVVLVKPLLLFISSLLLPLTFKINLLGFQSLFRVIFPYALAATGFYLVYAFLDRRVNVWVVTNHRLIDEWGVLSHQSKENPLEKIQDIQVKQSISGRMFGYGSVSVQTAATAGETFVDFVEKPRQLKEVIQYQQEHCEDNSDNNIGGRRAYKHHHSEAQTISVPEKLSGPVIIMCGSCGQQITINPTAARPHMLNTEINEERYLQKERPYQKEIEPKREGHTSGEEKDDIVFEQPIDPKQWSRDN